MVTNAMKTDAQRLGNGKKAFDVKQVEKLIQQGGGSGSEYTAGTGIDITENVISADTEVLATKSELPDMSDVVKRNTKTTLTSDFGLISGNNLLNVLYNSQNNSKYAAIGFDGLYFRELNPNSPSNPKYIGSVRCSQNNNLSSYTISITLSKQPSSTATKLFELVNLDAGTNDTWTGLGHVNTGTEFNGILFRYSSSGRIMFMGTTKLTNHKITSWYGVKYIFNSDTDVKMVRVFGTTEYEVPYAKELPAGKSLTDTVTFQDLVDLGLIKAPTTP